MKCLEYFEMNLESLFLPVLILGAGLLAGLAWLARRKAQREGQRQLMATVSACQVMLSLVARLQQHRGMSSAWLAGDESFRPRMLAKAREIEAGLPGLREVAVQESARAFPCLTVNQLALFRFNWQSLQERLAGLSVEQSIAQHSQLIEELLKWLAALGEARVESALRDTQRAALVRIYLSRLPVLTECLGQARALGASVAARGGCSAVARVRLMFLIARAEVVLGQAVTVCAGMPAGERASAAVVEMAQVVRECLMASEGVSISATAYFELATRAVDAVFAWIEVCGHWVASAALAVDETDVALTAHRV